jgi:hypothetical protein
VNADPPTRAGLRWLGEDQGMPGDFLVGFTHRLMDHRAQLTHQSLPPETAQERAVAEAVQAFAADAGERGWTVSERRITSLADDTLGLEDEYRDRHGYEPELARLDAVGEVLESERLRGEIPTPWWREADPPQQPDPTRGHRHPSERTPPDGRTDAVRTREASHER